ncbi:MAG: Na+/H+ antiporter subunit G [Rubrivivax sp.]|nr:MAG: Na+/H+ antiporter subunit G [Rubrivivax sp.]
MTYDLPLWSEVIVGLLLVLSGVLVLIGALGLLQLPDFFQRMHPPALGYTLASWSVTLASIIYFSVLESRLALHTWLIIILLSITAPITTTLLARAGLFRSRMSEGIDSKASDAEPVRTED